MARYPRFYQQVTEGKVPGYSIVHKFGQNTAVGTTFVPVALGGVYKTPMGANATALRIAAGNAADAAAGTGARTVRVQGLDANFDFASADLATNGASAGTPSSIQFTRIYRAFVTESGTYATQTSASHAGDIVVESTTGSAFCVIGGSASGFPRAQTEIGAYSVDRNHDAYLLSAYIFSDSSKTTEFIFFRRDGANETAAPYSAMRAVFEGTVEGGQGVYNTQSPVGPFSGPSDIGFLAKVGVGTANVTVDFEILLVAK